MALHRWSFVSVLVAVALAGCSGATVQSEKTSEPTPAPAQPTQPGASATPIDELAEKDSLERATTSATLASAALSLEGYVWRDDMPVAVDPGQPASASSGLMVSVKVTTAAGGAFPVGATLGKLFVVHGRDVWSSDFAKGSQSTPDVTVRGGPLWPGGDKVDVVVRLDASDGTVAYVAHRAVEIVSAQ